MNARSTTFEIDVEQRQVEEAVLAIFHTVLFQRTNGKYTWSRDDVYVIGAIGHVDVFCDYIDITYVRGDCGGELDADVKKDVAEFCEALKKTDSPSSGQISLEFYQSKKGRWAFQTESTPWEVWTVKVNVVKLSNENERQTWRGKVGHKLAEHIFAIGPIVCAAKYLPTVPNKPDQDLVFQMKYTDIQPYLFRINHSVIAESNPSVSTAVKKLLRDSLSFS